MTADDFGLSWAVNEAVEQAVGAGVLTCASLMVGEKAAADAVSRARRLPQLRVGLHVVVADGRPVLPPDEIPELCDEDGRLDGRLVRAGFRFVFNRRAARALESEIRAQFAAFAATGLALDHVNAHKHMHLHPAVLGIILKVGGEYGMRAVRLPREPLQAARSGSERRRWLLNLLVTGPWLRQMRWRLERAGMRHNDWVLGLSQSGAMDEDAMLALLGDMPEGVTELYCHPATQDGADVSPTGYRPVAEWQALMSTRVSAALRARARPCAGFRDLAADGGVP